MISSILKPKTVPSLRCLSTIRQVLLNQPGPHSALRFENAPYHHPPVDKDQIRVKVAACAVAYRDIIDRNGGFPFMNHPTVLGHEFSGVVDEAPEGSPFAVGDKIVSLHWAQFGGEAFPSPFNHKEAMKTFLGLTCNGGYGEYVTCHHTAFVKIPEPEKWTAVEAAPVMSTFGTVWQGAVVRGELKRGDKVLITGAAGGVGSAAVVMASRMGAHVIGTTGDPIVKSNYIKNLGADEVIDSAPGFSKAIGAGGGVDMAIECVGAPTFTDSLRSLRPGGKLILIGNVSNANAQLPLGLCIVKSLNVLGTDSIEAHEMTELFRWLDKEQIKPEIDRVLPLEKASEAHLLLENRVVSGRIVLDVNTGIWS